VPRVAASLAVLALAAGLAAGRAHGQTVIGVENAPPALRPARDEAVFAPVSVLPRAEVRAPVTRLAPSPDAPRAVRRAAPEGDPYAPLGIRLGTLTLRPSITQSAGWDTNPERVETGAEGRALSRTEGDLTLESDWSRHALTGSVGGVYDAYRGGDLEPRFSGAADLGLRLDIREDTALTLRADAATATERVGSPEVPSDLAEGPQTTTFGAEAELAMGFNRLQVALRGAIERSLNEDGVRADGTRVDRSDDDFTETLAALRLGYAVSPRLTPFVEAEIDRRRYEGAGATRDSVGATGRVGAEIEMTRLLTGEVSAGWQERDYEDPARGDASGAVAQARLVWTPTPLTTVTLAGESSIAETSVAGANAAQARRASVAIAHQLRRNLVLDASLSWAGTDYEGVSLSEELIAAAAGLEWRLNRGLAVTARYAHERLASTAPDGDHVADVALVGVRLTR
jgi:hypothetical protein